MTQVLTLVLLMARLGRLSDAFNAEICSQFGISASELRALACLRHAPGRRGTPSDLARLIVQTSGGLTATVRRLEQRGLVERGTSETDGRGRPVALTDAGAELHDRVLGELEARYGAVFADINVDDALGAVRAMIAPLERAMHAVPSSAWPAAAPDTVSA